MRLGQTKWRREFIASPPPNRKPIKHIIEVDFKKLGIGLTRKLAFTSLMVNIQSDLRRGICSELIKDCIHKGAIKLDIE